MFFQHRALGARTESLVKAYYFALLGVANFLGWPSFYQEGLTPSFRWPLGIFDGTPLPTVQIFCCLILILVCCLAGIWPRSQSFRILVFVALFLMNAVANSAGATTHLYQFWLWSAFIMATVPGRSKKITERRFYYYLMLGWWGAQAIVLMFYGLSGFWKTVGLFEQIFKGEPNLLSASGLSYHLASEMLRTGSQPLLGPWLLKFQWFSPVLAIAVIVLQLSCLAALFRGGWLRRAVGIGLILFHIGTYLFLAITYPTNVVLVGVLLATNSLPARRGRRFLAGLFRQRSWKLSYARSVCVVLVCYLAIALGTAVAAEGGEVFPFFNGHWFYKVPYELNDYSLLIQSLDGKELNPPLYIEHLYPKLKAWPFAIYGALQTWGRHVTQNNSKASSDRDFALQLIFKGRAFKCELRQRRINTLDFVQTSGVLADRAMDSAESSK